MSLNMYRMPRPQIRNRPQRCTTLTASQLKLHKLIQYIFMVMICAFAIGSSVYVLTLYPIIFLYVSVGLGAWLGLLGLQEVYNHIQIDE